ncbi:SRPBCC domain-containing protein [Gordonia sp. HY002]|uniref:SRPBCC domain-containing protein n=1 Tax=Gordonia zhenghanii TaxID=2911516 RepID=UPI001EF0D49D|nr:SRPBCC domain-containing protein [Gordonia zhenghanii]MCF8570077.1 SRPBCC domain-containing protein [Gordonia zhenghanii]MCF8605192.1 SRPBCC domain-containing protein [Gordonia zhenghanii]
MSIGRRDANGPNAAADREIVVSRVIDAPRELVFEAFTEARHLAHWWGPQGFTTTTRTFEFCVDGVWGFTMHGPDGTDYPEWITWTEITPPERIVMVHGESRDDPNAFESVLTFTADRGATTVEMLSRFPTRELRDEAIEKHGAITMGQQTLDSLAAHVLADAQQNGTQI